MNHLASGAFHSSTLLQRFSHCSSEARSAQNCSGFFCALRCSESSLTEASLRNSAEGVNVRFSLRRSSSAVAIFLVFGGMRISVVGREGGQNSPPSAGGSRKLSRAPGMREALLYFPPRPAR